MRWLSLLTMILLIGCSDRTAAPVVPEALNVGINRTVFIGTTRAMNDAGEFGIGRSPSLTLLQSQVSIPPEREVGTVSDGFDKPKPERDFALASLDQHRNPQSFAAALSQEITRSSTGRREVTVFVHGFNNSFADSAFRMAQLGHDLEVPGALVSYSWPSRANPLGYEYDQDSALFARDGLADLLRAVEAAGNPDILLVAHSMGSYLVMETLRQLEIAEPGWAERSLSGVILMSPDLNVDLFRTQIARFQTVPDPFVVVVSRKDIVLRLSARLRGERSQLGNINDAEDIGDLPVTVLDVSAFSDRQSGNHFIAAGSPALIQILKRSADLDREFVRGRTGATLVIPGQRRILTRATEIELTAPSRRSR
ncbi:alpha/beta fold hydrolase [uncultured Tateyamaria sp.]|uniref:alpha/beta hydrolase n=1 Tax=Tateyamaria sp. 1078 TaxID=3417464 RepID=UPI0026034CAD|nr:alpha/beta fold hydrolase [uncultured Tateyamaria sp.]